MALEEILKKSKKFVVVPLLGLALAYSPMDYKKCDINLEEKKASVNSIRFLENYSLNYDVGIYILGIKFFSCDADFYYKKIEENGLIKEFMGASGKYSDNYHGSLLGVVSKDEDPFERHSYFIKYNEKVFQNETVFYKDKVKIIENNLETIVYIDGYVGLQSVIKPLLTEDLIPGRVFNSKTFVEGKFYECRFVVKEKETISVKGKDIDAYHVVLKTGKLGSKKEEVADIWIAECEPYNKIVKVSFSPFILTEVKVFLDS